MPILFISVFIVALTCAQAAIAATLGLGLAELAPGDVVISEYLANPVGVADSEGEYFELFNTRDETVVLDGLLVRDDGSNEFTIGALSIEPHGYAVLGNSDGSGLGIAVDYDYGGAMSLTNGADAIVLVGTEATELFRLSYDDGDYFGAGIAHELLPPFAGRSFASGPGMGQDYVAATAPLALGNFGSPGGPANGGLPRVPVPGAAWLLASALLGLRALRRGRPARPGPAGLAVRL